MHSGVALRPGGSNMVVLHAATRYVPPAPSPHIGISLSSSVDLQVQGEKPPVIQRMIVMDGNNSLKRVAPFRNRKVGDTRTFDSNYYIPSEIVEKYANEVKSRQTQPHVNVPDTTDNDAASDDGYDGPEGDPTDRAPDSSCASNWKAAASDDKKKMWAIFEETGVFASACRHGFVLWLIDMIRSGEL